MTIRNLDTRPTILMNLYIETHLYMAHLQTCRTDRQPPDYQDNELHLDFGNVV